MSEGLASTLQIRAQATLARYRKDGSKPVVIEFAGTPKAGKTSTINQIQGFFKRCGFSVEVVIERASVCPIRDKKHSNFNIWTACTTLAQILEKTQDPPRSDDPQILFLDRGLFDAISWLTMMDRLSRIRTEDRTIVEKFLSVADWRHRITGVILMTASPDDAISRDRGNLPVTTTGSIMNPAVLEQILKTTIECKERLNKAFRIFQIDTSSGTRNDQTRTCEVVADIILNLIEEQLREDILHIKKSSAREIFSGQVALIGDKAEPLLRKFAKEGSFAPRNQVEMDAELVQALPVAIVRNKSGEVLRLKRRERSRENPLNEELVIWAGGHVRIEDNSNGDPIKQCLLRELQEELRLSVEVDELRFLGSIYSDTGGSTSKHLALVYEWRASTDDVAITLSTAEFFERRGTSLSGKFIGLRELAQDVNDGKVKEVWSVEIVRQLLQLAGAESPGLFG